jgi:hypothetical protein
MNALARKALKLAPPALAIALAGLAAPALAHHSFNMFALDQVVTVQGTVKDYQFKMPHVWFYMVIPTKTGAGQEEWGFECHSPNLVARKGWNLSTLKPGDKITVRMHPMKDGSKAGSVIDVTLADGKTLWNAQSVNQP